MGLLVASACTAEGSTATPAAAQMGSRTDYVADRSAASRHRPATRSKSSKCFPTPARIARISSRTPTNSRASCRQTRSSCWCRPCSIRPGNRLRARSTRRRLSAWSTRRTRRCSMRCIAITCRSVRFETLANFYAGYGANVGTFLSTANSFVIEAKMAHGNDLVRDYHIEATPTLDRQRQVSRDRKSRAQHRPSRDGADRAVSGAAGICGEARAEIDNRRHSIAACALAGAWLPP